MKQTSKNRKCAHKSIIIWQYNWLHPKWNFASYNKILIQVIWLYAAKDPNFVLYLFSQVKIKFWLLFCLLAKKRRLFSCFPFLETNRHLSLIWFSLDPVLTEEVLLSSDFTAGQGYRQFFSWGCLTLRVTPKQLFKQLFFWRGLQVILTSKIVSSSIIQRTGH